RHAVLVGAAEVDDAVGALVTATYVPGGDAAGRVPATGLRQRADQRLLRRGAGHLDEVGDAGAAAARRRRLVLTDSHVDSPRFSSLPAHRVPKMSMVPSRSVTIARLVSLRLPRPNRVRRVFPGRFIVCTDSTLTSKICSTARLISVLLARGSTTNVCLPWSSSA